LGLEEDFSLQTLMENSDISPQFSRHKQLEVAPELEILLETPVLPGNSGQRFPLYTVTWAHNLLRS